MSILLPVEHARGTPGLRILYEAMIFKDLDHSGGHEIDPNLVEIAEMQRIQEEMHEVTENAKARMHKLKLGRRVSPRQPDAGQSSRPQRNPSKPK